MTSRIIPASCTPRPSSEKPTAPSASMSPISASASPLLPTVHAPIGCTRTTPSADARSMMKRTLLPLSVMGEVLGMAQTAVKPPCAAARVPLAMVSLSSRPGSRRCVCTSTSPGTTTFSAHSTTVAPFAERSVPISAIRPSSMRTSRTSSSPTAGSTSRPPRSRIVIYASPPRSRYIAAILTATPALT